MDDTTRPCRRQFRIISGPVGRCAAAGRSARSGRSAAFRQGAVAPGPGAMPALRRLSLRRAGGGQPAASHLGHHRPGDEPGAVGPGRRIDRNRRRPLPGCGRAGAGPYRGALPELSDVDGRADRPHDPGTHRRHGDPVRGRRHRVADPHHPRTVGHRDLLHPVLSGGDRAGAGGALPRPETRRSRPQTGAVRRRAGPGRPGAQRRPILTCRHTPSPTPLLWAVPRPPVRPRPVPPVRPR